MIVIVGPTGVGKTAFSIHLASQFNGEIISADSRLFYKGMDIGTDKPSLEERKNIAHHLIDICDPDQTISLGQYKRMASKAITAVQIKGKVPFLVGGTGQYIRAIVEGWMIPEVAPDAELRRQLALLPEDQLTRWLKTLDPTAASRIQRNNKRRWIRALEVTLKTGKPFSTLQQRKAPAYTTTMIGLILDRETLYKKIDIRIDEMMNRGLLEEVIHLRALGYSGNLPSMSGLGYQQLGAYLDGDLIIEEAVDRIKFETHRFARQQHNWFRNDDEKINWFDANNESTTYEVEQLLSNWLVNDQ